MEKLLQITRNGHNIRCKLYFSKNAEIRKVVLVGHGFGGRKDNAPTRDFAERILTKYKGIAIMAFDLPCHGEDVKKKLILQDCMTYLEYVIDYIKTELHTEEIYSYATSFGGYLVLKYIAENGNPFAKIALRCPAIDMAGIMDQLVRQNNGLDELRKGKNVRVGFEAKIEISPQFLTDLEESDIRKNEYFDYADDILILHGTKDEVIPLQDSRQFADQNVIEFLPVENADHRFINPACVEAATKAVLSFFEF